LIAMLEMYPVATHRTALRANRQQVVKNPFAATFSRQRGPAGHAVRAGRAETVFSSVSAPLSRIVVCVTPAIKAQGGVVDGGDPAGIEPGPSAAFSVPARRPVEGDAAARRRRAHRRFCRLATGWSADRRREGLTRPSAGQGGGLVGAPATGSDSGDPAAPGSRWRWGRPRQGPHARDAVRRALPQGVGCRARASRARRSSPRTAPHRPAPRRVRGHRRGRRCRG
jgi:hypothetical protein